MSDRIVIDLSGVKNADQVLHTLGAIFEFGGPEGNIPFSFSAPGKGWGLNWSALNDSLRYLTTGGIWGTSKVFKFPLTIVFENSIELQEHEGETFNTMKDIFGDTINFYKLENKGLTVEFN